MKKNILFSALLLLVTFCAPANAYYLEHAVAGTLTLEVTGACAIPKVRVNAYIADISNDEHTPLGWGIVTASGHLVALRESATDVMDRTNFSSQQQTTKDYVDLAGETLKAFLVRNGVRCEVARLQSDINSLLTTVITNTGGQSVLHATVKGYEPERCQDSGDVQTCKARRINVQIDFSGKR